ncbi:MAG: hypothetical protein ACRC9V_08690 [Aeromonas sp.]
MKQYWDDDGKQGIGPRHTTGEHMMHDEPLFVHEQTLFLGLCLVKVRHILAHF